MILSFPGGIPLPLQTDALSRTEAYAQTAAALSEVFLALPRECTLHVREGDTVGCGELIATGPDGSPIYASVPGVFDGVFQLKGDPYAKLIKTDKLPCEPCEVRPPEQRRLQDIPPEELLQAVQTLGIFDVFSGDLLHRRVRDCRKEGTTPIRRVVIDTIGYSGALPTESRAALLAPNEVLGGAKILLQLLGATKIILLADPNRPQVVQAFRAVINDPKLTVVAELQAKLPMVEQTVCDALYAQRLPRGIRAQDAGVFFLRAQTAVSLYRAFLTGKPQVSRWVSAVGEGFGKPGVYELPFGLRWKSFLSLAQHKGGAYEAYVDSPLSKKAAEGVIGGSAEGVFAAVPIRRTPSRCMACGSCAEVCPMRLQPFRILTERSYRSVKTFASVCIGCGCCDYICPSQLPLRELIARHRGGA